MWVREIWDEYLETILEHEGEEPMGTYWVVSASNPMDRRLTDEENERRHAEMVDFLDGLEVVWGEAVGSSRDGSWSERMLVLAGAATRMGARVVGKFWDQRAVFEIDGDVRRVVDVESGAVMREKSGAAR